jgi:hypothetical protein
MRPGAASISERARVEVAEKWIATTPSTTFLAAAILRFQCMECGKASGEAAVSSSQSGAARVGRASGAVEVEQLQSVCVWGNGSGAGE